MKTTDSDRWEIDKSLQSGIRRREEKANERTEKRQI